ncbi:MAG: Pls/PosA family non-ribosomal peptide synthetase [Pseudonocardia sp.]
MTVQDKADRKNLPPPTGRAGSGAGDAPHVAPATDTERALAEALAGVLKVEGVSVQSHFFDDLAANSLLMARFATQVRKLGNLPRISIKDIYVNPTVRSLATALDALSPAPPPASQQQFGANGDNGSSATGTPTTGTPTTAGGSAALPTGGVVARPGTVAATPPTPHRASNAAYRATGFAQLAVFLVTTYLGARAFRAIIEFVFAATTPGAGLGAQFVEFYQRSALVGGLLFVGFVVLPIAAKWLLVGRWTTGEIRLWSPGYLRFWLVKTLVQVNPMVLFAGTPLFMWYLRALGAKIGKGVMVHARRVPVATDLITLGDGAVIGKNAVFSGYRAVHGVIQLGPVSIGRGAHVSEKTVLDIHTELGDGAELGHSSALQAGQAVPAGQTWHGCPAEQTSTSYRTCPELPGRQWRKVVYTLFQLFTIFVVAPAGLALAVLVLPKIPPLTQLYNTPALLGSPVYYLVVVAVALTLFVLGLAGGLLFIATVPRLLHRMMKPDKAYPLFGLFYILHQAITGMTNSKLFMYMFGDSSAVTHHLRFLGYDLGTVQQSGSNFGTELRHDSPYLTSIGTGTMVSDALEVNNASYSRTAFMVSPVEIGPNNYLGNHIAYPPGGRTGENVLLATKVLVPIDGPVWENCGMLGAPPFRIPRSVDRDSQFDHLKEPETLRRRLRGKNRHNFRTGLLFVGLGWLRALIAVLSAGAVLGTYRQFAEFALMGAAIAGLLVFLALGILAERLVLGFGRLRPKLCSIYDPYFWHHERLWKLLFTPRFPGTPLNPLLWRLGGVRMGKRVFDDGVGIPEKTLAEVGDDATLNFASVIQCHSLEDGTFKSDHSVLGAGATLGVAGFAHYGVTMGPGSYLDADAFLMKGEEVAEGERWFGNPARPEYERELPRRDYDELLRERVALLDELALVRRSRRQVAALLGAAAAVLALVNVSFVVDPSRVGPARPVAERLQALVPAMPVAELIDGDEADAPAQLLRSEDPATSFVEEFYEMLPGDTAAAFRELTPEFQRQVGGTVGFTRLYRQVASVAVEDPVTVGEGIVEVTVRTRLKGGAVTTERIAHTVTPAADDDTLRLADATPLP